jgi:hypothetical protein
MRDMMDIARNMLALKMAINYLEFFTNDQLLDMHDIAEYYGATDAMMDIRLEINMRSYLNNFG